MENIVDFKDLKKACPKESFSFLKIDQLVDATTGNNMMSFTDAYSGYNHVKMAPKDEGNYRRRDLLLKSCAFRPKKRWSNISISDDHSIQTPDWEDYGGAVDDMLFKSKQASLHVTDLTECFAIF